MTEIEKAIAWCESRICGGTMPGAGKMYKVCLAALREKQEREKGCSWCRDEEQRNDSGRIFYNEFPHDARVLTTLDDAHLQLAYDEKGGWVLHFEDDYGDRMFDVKVTACPMCGRRLKEARDV